MSFCGLSTLKAARTETDVIAVLDTVEDDRVARVVVNLLTLDTVPKPVKAACARYSGFHRLSQEVGEAEARRLLDTIN